MKCYMPLQYYADGFKGTKSMLTRRKLALYFLAALALAGAYDAMRNLPVLSGCNFYSECPDNSSTSNGALGH